MQEFITILVGALVSCASYFINYWTEQVQHEALRTALKALVTLVVSVALATLQLVVTGTLTWATLFENLPLVIASAMTFYGLILKPATK